MNTKYNRRLKAKEIYDKVVNNVLTIIKNGDMKSF